MGQKGCFKQVESESFFEEAMSIFKKILDVSEAM
jgi:hypothetical protein